MLEITYGTLSWLTQVTVASADTVDILGEKLKFAMAISFLSALAEIDVLGSTSRPRMLVREASATNRKIAKVPVFKCRRNGVSTVAHLAADLG